MHARQIATWLGASALVVVAAALTISSAVAQPASQPASQQAAASSAPAPSVAGSLPKACMGGSGCPGSTCPASITPASAVLPTAACPANGESQDGVDTFSWNEFIALNWPAMKGCVADPSKTILKIDSKNQGPVVWQTQASVDDVFVAPGKAPAAWCGGAQIAELFAGKPHVMGHNSKGPLLPEKHMLTLDTTGPTDIKAVGGVVTDPSGRWLRFERLMDQTEYKAIVGNKWYSASVLGKLQSITLPTGSLELKSAWKILTPAEIAGGRYYTTTAIVYNDEKGDKSPGPNPVTLGLVGLHIIQKTPQQSGFFWSTFEHVDNDTVFANPGSKEPVNTQTAKKPYTELDTKTGKPLNPPIPMKRVTPIPADPALNAYYQKLLAGSVFANYRLISTQWGTGFNPLGKPKSVANLITEVFVQSVKTKQGGEGCLACHLNATANNTIKTVTDHSFMFLEAK